MTKLASSIRQSAYHLSTELEEPAPAPSVFSRTEADEVKREEVLLAKLGVKGWGRVFHFRNYYTSSWGENGRPLSPRALDAFFIFIEKANFPVGKPPSVFLTDRGGIELCWEDSAGKEVQVEFTGTGAEFYSALTEEQGEIEFADVAQLPERLSM